MSSNRELQKGNAVILTALRAEYMAVRAHLHNIQEETYKGTVYERGTFTADKWLWSVGIAEIGVGNSNAAVETDKAITYFNPSVLLFVGVSGGVKDVRLGDVVVATKVYGYEAGKLKDGLFVSWPSVGESSHRLVQRAQAEGRREDWLQRASHCEWSLKSHPRVLVGPIAAGEKVLADIRSDIYQLLYTHYNDTLAVEMEGRGFLSAAHGNESVQALIIRGISDLIECKSEISTQGSQVMAACHASAFAFEILAKLDTPEIQRKSIKSKSSTNTHKIFDSTQDTEPIEVFFSYEESDERLVEQLRHQLYVFKRNNLITNWYTRQIVPGQKPDEEITRHLSNAQIILLLISPSFMASEHHSIEVQRAMERCEAGEAIIIPILLRPTAHWHDTAFGKLQIIPRNGKAVTLWPNADLAFAQVAEEIGEVIKLLKRETQ